MGNNNSLAHRYRKKGLIILAGIWMLIFLAAAGEAIHTRISVPAHHRTRSDLLASQISLAQAYNRLDLVTEWALCLQDEKPTTRRLGTIDFLDELSTCSDPR